jgi:Cu-processing system ATP-binding protein
LFLDEPTTGLDPRAIHFFWDTLAELRAQGLTIVLTSHVLAELQHRVDRVAVMANGRVQALGSLAELRAAFDLPLTLRVQRAHGVELLRVPRSRKRALLLELLHADDVADVQIDEPSLEDMFFGDGGAGTDAGTGAATDAEGSAA